MTLPIFIKGREFILHCSGAMFWPEKKILFISDVHLGKVTHFRKHGIAVPRESVYGNFDQLSKVAAFFDPELICFLGDLFHSKLNSEWHLFVEWVAQTQSRITLISGNHDIISDESYLNLGVDVFDELIIDGFLLTHHPEQRALLFNFCGHIHPGVLLHGFGRQFMQLPCFFESKNQLILPAFGTFTGKFLLKPGTENRVYVLADNEVVFVK